MGRGFDFKVHGELLGGPFLLVVDVVALLALAGLAIFLLIVLAVALLVALALLTLLFLIALALPFLVSIALHGVLRVRLLSSLFVIHRSPFIISINSDWGARRATAG